MSDVKTGLYHGRQVSKAWLMSYKLAKNSGQAITHDTWTIFVGKNWVYILKLKLQHCIFLDIWGKGKILTKLSEMPLNQYLWRNGPRETSWILHKEVLNYMGGSRRGKRGKEGEAKMGTGNPTLIFIIIFYFLHVQDNANCCLRRWGNKICSRG